MQKKRTEKLEVKTIALLKKNSISNIYKDLKNSLKIFPGTKKIYIRKFVEKKWKHIFQIDALCGGSIFKKNV